MAAHVAPRARRSWVAVFLLAVAAVLDGVLLIYSVIAVSLSYIAALVFIAFWGGIFAAGFGAWCQHLYTCFTQELWAFLIAGAIFFPIGIIHGVGIWFGWW